MNSFVGLLYQISSHNRRRGQGPRYRADSLRLLRDRGSKPAVQDDIRGRIEQIVGCDLTGDPISCCACMEAKEALSLPPDPRLTTLIEHQATLPLAQPDTNNALWDAPALLTFDATPQEASLQDRDYRGGDRIAPQRHAGCGMGGAKMCEIGRLKSVGLIAALTRSTLDVRPPSGPGQHSPT